MRKLMMYGTSVVLFLALTFTVQAQEETATAASLYNEALEFSKTKEYAKALPLYLKAIELAQEEDNQQVIRLSRANGTRTAYALGKSLNDDDPKAAIDAYDKGIELDSTFYINYYGKAKLLEDDGNIGEALVAYVQAGNILAGSDKFEDQEKSTTYFNKAESMVGQPMNAKKWDDLHAYSEAYLKLRQTPEAYYYLGVAQKEKGQAEQAIESLGKAIETAGDGSDTDKYYMAKAEAHEKLGQTDAAVAAYKQVGGKYAERAQYKVNELGGGK